MTALAVMLRTRVNETDATLVAQAAGTRSYENWPPEALHKLAICCPFPLFPAPRNSSVQIALTGVTALEQQLANVHTFRSWMAEPNAGAGHKDINREYLAQRTLESVCRAVSNALGVAEMLAPLTRPSEAGATAAEVGRHRALIGMAQDGQDMASLGQAIRFAAASAAPAAPTERVSTASPPEAAAEPAPPMRHVATAIETAPRIELPHRIEVEAALGGVDLSTVHAHLDARSTSALDASAYTTTATDGAQHIVFAETPSVATVTHEATHVLQQRAGLVPGGLGAADTTFEHEAESAAAGGGHNRAAPVRASGSAASWAGGLAPVQREPKNAEKESVVDAGWRKLLGAGSKPVNRPARVDQKPGVRLRQKPLPHAPEFGVLPFNQRVVVLRALSDDWVYVQPVGGQVKSPGFLPSFHIAYDPPGLQAQLVWVDRGQGVTEFLRAQYPELEPKAQAASGALDNAYMTPGGQLKRRAVNWRPFVEALVKLNLGREGVFQGGATLSKADLKDRDEAEQETLIAYKSAVIKAGTAIWVPTSAQVRAMLQSGQVTDGRASAGKVAVNRLTNVPYYAGYLIGVPQGAAAAVTDLVRGVPDAVELIGEIIGQFLGAMVSWDSGPMVDDIGKVLEGLKGGLKELHFKWNQEGDFARGEFQGHVTAYVLFQVVVAAVLPQLAAANTSKLATAFKGVAALDKYSSALDLSADALKGMNKYRKAMSKTGGEVLGRGVIGEAVDSARKGSRAAEDLTDNAPSKGIIDSIPQPGKKVEAPGPEASPDVARQIAANSHASSHVEGQNAAKSDAAGGHASTRPQFKAPNETEAVVGEATGLTGTVTTGKMTQRTAASVSSVATEGMSTIQSFIVLTTHEGLAAHVAIHGKLPGNFITKAEARALGWNPRLGNLGDVAPGKSIGGDVFRNSEGLLPSAAGRIWFEADVGYASGFRGVERLLYSSDGLIFKTLDHYKTFLPM